MTADLPTLRALKEKGWLHFFNNKQPKCPHCGSDFDIADNEAWFLYDENNSHDVECQSCSLPFQVSSRASWSFSTDEQEEDDA